MDIFTGLRFFYSSSKVIFSATDGPICGFDIPNKIYWREDDFRMPYCFKGAINYRVFGMRTWCGGSMIQQRGVKLMAPS